MNCFVLNFLSTPPSFLDFLVEASNIRCDDLTKCWDGLFVADLIMFFLIKQMVALELKNTEVVVVAKAR